jgi:hypothetical protein
MDDNPETQLTDLEETPTPTKKSYRWLWLILGIALVLVLGTASYVGGRLLTGGGIPGLSAGGLHSSDHNFQPSEELPQTPPDVGKGIFDHRQGNSIFVGTGQVQMSMKQDSQSGQVQTSTSHNGPVVEVVVTTQTKIYKDTTMQKYNGQPPRGQTIQQVIKPGSLDEIGQYSIITVWGKKTGVRYIADILVFSTPTFIPKPKPGAPPG